MGTVTYPRNRYAGENSGSKFIYKGVKERFKALQEEYENSGIKVLRSTLKGNHGVLALHNENTGNKFINIYRYRTDAYEIYEKGFSESCGVFFYDVPLTYIKLTECDGKTDGAKEWRNNVIEFNEEKKRLKSLTLIEGEIYSLYGVEYRYLGDRQVRSMEDGRVYRMKASQEKEMKKSIK